MTAALDMGLSGSHLWNFANIFNDFEVEKRSRGKPTVLVDCDGVLASFNHGVVKIVNDIAGTEYSVAEINKWKYSECEFFFEAANKLRMSPSQLKAAVAGRVEAPGFCENLPVLEGAVEAIKQLKAIANVYAVTAPWHSSPTWMYERTRWLQKHVGIYQENVVGTSAKQLVHGDFLIDDRVSHIRSWQAAWPKGQALLFDAPHNKLDGFGLKRAGWGRVITDVMRWSS